MSALLKEGARERRSGPSGARLGIGRAPGSAVRPLALTVAFRRRGAPLCFAP